MSGTSNDYLDPPIVHYAVTPVVGADIGLGNRHFENSLIITQNAWADVQVGDTYEVHVGTAKASDIVQPGQQAQRFFHLAIPRENLQRGFVSPCYARLVRAVSLQESTSENQTWLILPEFPGDYDKDPGVLFHSELRMHVASDLQVPGVVLDLERAREGVEFTFMNYPKRRVRDQIELSWNGRFLFLVLDEEHINNTKPMTITVPEATIIQAGGGLITARFRVRNEVGTYSGPLQQWSDKFVIEAELVQDQLPRGYFTVDDVEDSEVNVDLQASGPFHVHVTVPGRLPSGVAVPSAGVQVLIVIEVIRNDLSKFTQTLPSILGRPNRAVAALVDISLIQEAVGGLIRFRYEFRTGSATGPIIGTSGWSAVTVFGTATNMPPVSVKQADFDLINPNEPFVNVNFPTFTPYGSNYQVTLRIEAITSGGGVEVYEQTLLAGAPPPPVRSRTVPRSEFIRFVGLPNVKVTYLTDDGVTVRESAPLYVRFGEAVPELPKPLVAGVDSASSLDLGGFVGPGIVTLTDSDTVAGDSFTWRMAGTAPGGSTGNAQSPIILNNRTAGKPVTFAVERDFFVANDNGEFSLRYSKIPVDGGPIQRSEVLVVSVGKSTGELETQVVEATSMPNELSPGLVVAGATVRISHARMAAADQYRMEWEALSGGGSYKETKSGTSNNRVEFTVPPEIIGINLLPGGRDITVKSYLIRGGRETPAPLYTFRLLPIKPIPVPAIENIGDRADLDLSQLTGTERILIGAWRYIQDLQRVWLELRGTSKDGASYFKKIYAAELVASVGQAQGIKAPLPGDVSNLQHDSDLTIAFKVAYNRSSNESDAIEFTSRKYRVQAMPTLTLRFSMGLIKSGQTGAWTPSGLMRVVTSQPLLKCR